MITARQTSEAKELHPSGLHNAVLVDVTEPELKETPWGHKEKVRLIFETDKKHPEFDGPFRVSKQYTLSLHEKSNLTKDLESWFGKSIPPDKRKEGIDLETLIGRRASVVIIHADDDQGTTWANISTLIPPSDTNQLVPSPGYVREKNRDGQSQGDGSSRQITTPSHTVQQVPTVQQVYQPATAQPVYQPAGTAQPAYQPAGTTATPPAVTYPEDDLPF